MCAVVLPVTHVERADAHFWDEFVSNHWNTGPVHLRFTEPPLDIDGSSAFDAVVRAADEYRERAVGSFVNMYVNGHRREADLDPLLPVKTDATYAGYGKRVAQALVGAEFTLSVFGCHRFSRSIGHAARVFMAPLFARIGLPPREADVDVFFGHYSRTPFGIHKDHATNFSLVVSGAKSMLFWPTGRFRNRHPDHPGYLGRSDYETFAADALRIDASPGDLIFWPASYWHIGIADDTWVGHGRDWPTTVNIAMYQDSAVAARMNEAMMPFLASALAPAMSAPRNAPGSAVLPAALGCALQALRDAMESGALEERLHDLWLRYVSAGGFRAARHRGSTLPRLHRTDRLRLAPNAQLVWRLTATNVRIGANGHLLQTTRAAAFERVLARLTRGDVLTLTEAVEDAMTASEGRSLDQVTAGVQRLFERLCVCDTLEVVITEPSACFALADN